MRIGINCLPIKHDMGGIKQYFNQLFTYLLKEDTDNCYIFFYSTINKKELSSIFSVGQSSNCKFISVKRHREIKQYLYLIDIYFCPFGSLYPRPLPVPTVVTLVDIQEVFFPQFFTKKDKLNRAFHYIGSTKMADIIITISEFSKDTIVKHHNIPPSKIIVSHLCADEKFYCSNHYKNSLQYDLPKQYIFYPANYWLHKNHDILLHALSWLKNHKSEKINLVLTGYEQQGGYPLRKKIEEFGLQNQINVLGYVSKEELIYLYKNASILVFPSLYEGFGIPLVEAMVSGCPILAANTTSLPEIGKNGACYFDPNSHIDLGIKILNILSDDIIREKLISRGYERARDFSVEKMAAIHLKAFRSSSIIFNHNKYLYNKYILNIISYFKHTLRFISNISL